jgi:glutathione S-transferase
MVQDRAPEKPLAIPTKPQGAPALGRIRAGAMFPAMLEVYGYLRDPFAWRVRFAAEEKGVPYQWIPSDVAFPDPRSARNNPRGRSPIAVHDGFVLTDAFNIQLYVDEAFPGRALQPESPRGRAEVRMFVASLEPLAAVLSAAIGPSAFNRRGYRRMDDVFASVNEALESGGDRPWLDGDRPGLRDTSFLPLLSELETMETSFPLNLEALAAYWQRAMAYPPFQKTNYRTAEIQGRRS